MGTGRGGPSLHFGANPRRIKEQCDSTQNAQEQRLVRGTYTVRAMSIFWTQSCKNMRALTCTSRHIRLFIIISISSSCPSVFFLFYMFGEAIIHASTPQPRLRISNPASINALMAPLAGTQCSHSSTRCRSLISSTVPKWHASHNVAPVL